MSNKPRVYVAGYFRQGITRNPESKQLGHARFHWAVWVVPKGSTGRGASYQVRYEDAYTNVPGSGGWKCLYDADDDYVGDPTVIGRLMIGKLPPGVSHEDVRAVLEKVALPREDAEPLENCVSWTREAVRELQQWGWAEKFEVEEFIGCALGNFTQWFDSGEEWSGLGFKENYVRNRKFP